MKKIIRALIVLVFLSLVLQNVILIIKSKDLEKSLKNLTKITQIQKDDVEQIFLSNLSSISIMHEIVKSSNDVIYLCVDYPFCEACFNDVIYYLKDYVENKNLQLIILCEEPYIALLEKKLLFNDLGTITVSNVSVLEQFTSKMTVAFKSKHNNFFYIPLPEKREIDFLTAFLK